MTLCVAIERIELIPQRAPDAFAGWIWLAVLLVVCLAAGTYVSRRAWRSPGADEPEERAFRALARRLRVGWRDRAAARDIARRASVPPVALLLSRAAFDAASTRAEHPRSVELRRRLFDRR